MAVHRACYATRADIMTATDIKATQDNVRHVDSAIESASEDVDKLTHRRFYNVIETKAWDWPNFQLAYPWRIWFDQAELADVTVNVPVVTTGGTLIPNSAILWGHPNYSPPYTYMELDRSQSYAFGAGNTPQRDVKIDGTFGYWIRTKPGGELASSVASTTATTVTVSDSSLVSVGDVITVDSESMLVSDWAMAGTGQAQSGSGLTTANSNDVTLTVQDGTQVHAGEYLQLDSEWVLAESVTGNHVMVVRAALGTVIAEHSGAEVYAMRQLTVERGFGGTTAASHAGDAPVLVSLVPGQVRELAIAESLNYVFQKTSAYARTIGEGSGPATPVPGGSLPDLRKRVYAGYGRKGRQRVI